MSAPCKGCTKRKVGCHSDCDDYIAFSGENLKRREAANAQAEITHVILTNKRAAAFRTIRERKGRQ